MNEILGYGENSFTLWALKKRISEILDRLDDTSSPPDCLIFYHPSFSRVGKGIAQFGEFDSILASSQNIYLIESKWDKFSEKEKDEIEPLKKNQILRHKIFSWYYMNWDAQQYPDWSKFRNAKQNDFINNFPGKQIPRADSRLAQNLVFVLDELQKHSKRFSYRCKIPRNILLYFHGGKSTKMPVIKDLDFEVVDIDYSQSILGNFIPLD